MIRTGVPTALDDSTMTGILAGYKTTTPVGRSKFHGKDMAFCPRKAVLIQVAKKPGPNYWYTKSEFYTAIGNALHSAACNIWKAADVLVAEELRVENSWLNLGAYVDAILKIEGRLSVAEIKTCKTPPFKPYLDHKFQVATYGLLTRIKDTRILYIGRNVMGTNYSLDVTEFDVDISFQQQALTNITTAKTFFDLGLVPPIPAHIKNKSACSFCPFNKYCWEAKKLDFEPFKLWSGASLKPQLDKTKKQLIELIKAGEIFKEDESDETIRTLTRPH